MAGSKAGDMASAGRAPTKIVSFSVPRDLKVLKKALDAIHAVHSYTEVSNARWSVTSRLCVLLAVMMLAPVAVAQTYSVTIKPSLHDLDIGIETVETTGMLIIKLTNKTDGKVRCDLRYDAAPQTPYRKTTYVDPGKTEQSTFVAKRKWFSVEVAVECKPVEK
jgi:hypothetical protein